MRDIRGDLRDRVGLLKDQINAAEADFERHIEQLKQEHDGKLKDLRENLEAVNRLMGVEHKRLGGVSSAPDAKAEPAEQKPQTPQGPQAQARPAQVHSAALAAPLRQGPSQMRLADFLMRKLGEIGPLQQNELCRLAVQEGYFPDSDGADQIVQETLMQTVKAGFVRQLSSGAFALPAVTDMIRLRRAG
ncbi:MAG: hypothetical protein R3D30_13435 [Hyphomicrobiales bacterium]